MNKLGLALEVDILIGKGKLGSAIKLIATELDKIPTCKLAALLKEKKEEIDLEDSLDQAHHRLDSAYERLNYLENKLEELLK